MGTTPTFRLLANSEDITATIRQRFVSLRLTDEAGLQSDALEILLADHDPKKRLDLPPAGAELELWLGYDGQATRMGLFVVDELELAGPPDTMTIRAKAATHEKTPAGKTGFQTQKTRSWEAGTTLGDMASMIAEEQGLAPAVAAELAAIRLPHVDQVNESDMSLLTRLAKPHGAIAKPAGGKLVLARKGAANTVSGKALPSITLSPKDVTNWRVTIAKRGQAGSVVAVWRDVADAEDREISVGNGEPVKRLRNSYSDEASASAAARAEHQSSARGERELSLTLPGNPALLAEGPLELTGFRGGVDGAWVVKRVEHSLDSGGYRCNVTANVTL